MKTLIRFAQVVLPESVQSMNVLLEGARIAALDVPDGATADEVIDARGLHLLPGVVDDQVHFREPGLTHKEDLQTATRACAGWRDVVSGDAEHEANDDNGGCITREAIAGIGAMFGELWFLHWGYARECGGVVASGADSWNQDIHWIQHGRSAG
jgi:hypothetical protein